MQHNRKKDISGTILGIDPGTRITGYGLIKQINNQLIPVDFGCIKPPPAAPIEKKYFAIYTGIEALILDYHPIALSVETQFVSKNPQSAIKLGMARGAALIAAAKYDIPVFEYTPSKAKRAVVGSGGATKAQVQHMMMQLLQLSEVPHPEDAADALALAICHAFNNKELNYV